MFKGEIVRYDPQKGYGFILLKDGLDGEVFFHAKALIDQKKPVLKAGDWVLCEIAEGQKGPQAINVKAL